jgi:hypothetical protein
MGGIAIALGTMPFMRLLDNPAEATEPESLATPTPAASVH